MRAWAILVAVLPALSGGAVQAGAAGPASRGAMLYENHCGACHSEQMHWRAKRQVHDWPSLRAQVRQWQARERLDWSEDDIEAVSRHLNDTIYRLPAPQGIARR